ncbi:hypothetical protein TSUD_302350 [Trifolium subterraneum]|uniref:MULE transposase domain-containing protein n=1 Tax=Trifolium subterraneum TaxID=3900 RepID=A0A2Z6P577_TRISU|nr:hypothetical protein TSUD_302350 [Trifolium subterraneum]
MAQTCNTGQNLVDTTDVFTTNDKFDTREVVLKWAKDVGIANKVSIIITRSDKKNGVRGRNDKLILDDANFVTCNRRRDDDSDVLSDIFLAHPDSIKLLNLFPIVLTMDCTYKTNKYRLPLLEIVGTTSTDMTFVVGFAYMEYEKTDNYRWALEKLKGLFTKQDILPQVIVTDRELALMHAIEFVFPHTVNLLCTWHVNKNVSVRCSVTVLVPKDMRDLVKDLWKNVVLSSNEVEYGLQLNEFEQTCVNSSKFLDYVKNSWLNNYKERFVAAWTNKVMHLGNTSTNRVESTHWKLKQMLEHNKGTVGTNKNLCGCALRSTHELPCACELSGYTLSGVPIPLDSIHGHWKKLTMEAPLEDDTEDNYELDMTPAFDAIRTQFQPLDIVGKRELKSKVFELAYPTTSSLCPPPEPIKTRGGVKKKYKGKAPKDYDVYHDPSYFKHVEREVNDSQGTSKRLCTQTSQASQKQLSQPSQKAIAYLLGYTEDGWPVIRRELDNELTTNNSLYEKLFRQNLQDVRDSLQIDGLGDQLEDKWFTIPAMGYLVANRFLCIGFVGGNHWVPVNMRPGYPLPDVTLDWKKCRSPEATSWMSNLTDRLQYCRLQDHSVKPSIGVVAVD